jgi:hypothetical protein
VAYNIAPLVMLTLLKPAFPSWHERTMSHTRHSDFPTLKELIAELRTSPRASGNSSENKATSEAGNETK